MAGGRQQEEETRDKGRQALVCILTTRSHLLLLAILLGTHQAARLVSPGFNHLSVVSTVGEAFHTQALHFFPVA